MEEGTMMQGIIDATIGGVLIGISAVVLMALMGRIAGVSGIVLRLLPPNPASDWGWRVAFLVGVIAGPVLVGATMGETNIGATPAALPAAILAGALVGVGTAYGNGCTSGHGICGISRLSVRSIAATGMFMVTAIATVYLSRHVF
jgi:uncharacterized membrane protein YedE/YeeE